MMDINKNKELLYNIVGILYDVHKELGAGLNEAVYQEGLKIELELQDIQFEKEVSFHPIYKGKEMESLYRLDFLIDDDVIVELKAVSELTDDHRAQLFNYMHLRKPIAGILVNFATRSCQIERYMYDMERNVVLTMDGFPISRKK